MKKWFSWWTDGHKRFWILLILALVNDVDLEPRDTSSPKYSLMNRLRKPYLPVWFGGLGLCRLGVE